MKKDKEIVGEVNFKISDLMDIESIAVKKKKSYFNIRKILTNRMYAEMADLQTQVINEIDVHG
jgi:hypothetical protein